ncbi:MAG: protein kinase [Deltaproteobacteria bacterium]
MSWSEVSSAPLGPDARVGPYEIRGHLATGGMGEVYIARKRGIAGFERMVVLKIMLAHLAHDERFSRMFIDEARICSQLSHPNIVQVFDLGESESGALFLAMEHLSGHSVAECIKVMAQRGVWIPIEIAVRMIADAAHGLAYAHAATDTVGESLDLVHRDISPENLFATYAGPVKILDFGVAKVKGNLAKTQHGEFKGKVGYMAPEIIRGQPADPRCDMFSLGIVLFEMLTNRRLFHAAVPATALHRVLSGPIPRVQKLRGDVDDELASIVHGMLERDPKRRLGTSEGVAARLEGWLAGRDVTNKVVGDWLREAFKDAHEAQARIQHQLEATGRIDPAQLKEVRRLGGADIADTVVRELSSEEREAAAWDSQNIEVEQPGVFLDDDRWIRRSRWSRWALLIVLLAMVGYGGTKLVEKSIADVRDTPREGATYAERYLVESVVESSPSIIVATTRDTTTNEALLLRATPPIVTRRSVVLGSIHRANAELEKLKLDLLPPAKMIGVAGDRIYSTYPVEEGRTLETVVTKEAISTDSARSLVVDIAEGIAQAHAVGVVHGALDPTTIWVTRKDHRPRILGFQSGVATVQQLSNATFIAPEHKPDVPQGPAVDQYALAAVLSECLKALDQEGAVLAAGVLARATAVEPKARFKDVSELVGELRRALKIRRR